MTNILTENVLLTFSNAISGITSFKVLCFGNFNPLSRQACEFLDVAYDNINNYKIISQSKPIIIVPIFKKKFINNSVWESSLCGISNHKKVDYVIDVATCSHISVIDRVKPDFIFFDKRNPVNEDIDFFIKNNRIKASRV
jgi:hypothetical protein